MKIAVSVNTSWNLVNFRLNLLLALMGSGNKVLALAPRDEYTKVICDHNIEYREVKIKGTQTSFLVLLFTTVQYLWVLFRERPAVYISFTIKPNLLGGIICRLLGIPRVMNIAGRGLAFEKHGWIRKSALALYNFSFDRNTFVFFQNKDDMNFFLAETKITRSQSGLLPGSGVDLSRFEIEPLAPVDEGEGQGPVFLMIGRLLHTKGVVQYVESARAVRLMNPSAQFRLLGIHDLEHKDAISQDYLDGLIAEGIIEIIPRMDDVRKAISAAHCVVLPTYYPEGTPRTLLEAAAMGRPIITTDTAGCRDVVLQGKSGFLCEPQSVMDLTRCMMKVCELGFDRMSDFGRTGRQHIEENYDEKLVIARYQEVLSQLLVRTSH